MVSASQQASKQPRWQPVHEYNFEHYLIKHLALALSWTAQSMGVHPGQAAPDFELESTDGGRVRLSSLRGQPVVLRFGSFT